MLIFKDWAKDSIFDVDIEVEVNKENEDANATTPAKPAKPIKQKKKKKGLHEKTMISRSINMEIVVSSGPKSPPATVSDFELDDVSNDVIISERREPIIRIEDDTDMEAMVTIKEDDMEGNTNESFRL